MVTRGEGGWKGTSTELLAALTQILSEGTLRSKTWPKTPKALASNLRRLVPFLRQAGVEVDFPIKRDGRHKFVMLLPAVFQTSEQNSESFVMDSIRPK